jgi:CubicO group peptidase (beta-lactamase class C family)
LYHYYRYLNIALSQKDCSYERLGTVINADALKRVDQFFDGYFAQGRTPGLLYGVAVGNSLLHWKAIGDAVIGETPVRRSTSFRVASLTKSFTATAILMLRDQELINLDSSFVTYIPELFPHQIEVFEVTVRQLLSMSSGFPTDNDWADRVESWSDEEFNSALEKGFRFDSRPGTRYEYSNLGYALLARIIANVSKNSYIEYVTKEIIEMVGLTSTTFHYEDAIEIAMGYTNIDGWKEEPHQMAGAFSSIGGLITTLDDLVAWSAYLSSAFNPHSPEVGPLKKSSRREMQNIQQDIPKIREPNTDLSYSGINGYGFGLRVEEDDVFGKVAAHSGGYPGFGAHMRWHAQSGLSVVALANGRYASPVTAAIPALRTLLRELPTTDRGISSDLQESQRGVHLLLMQWEEKLADELFAINMDLDFPRDFRKAQILQAGQLTGNFRISHSHNSSHLKWVEEGEKKSLEIEIWLTPLSPAKLQALKISTVDFFDTGLHQA